MASLRDKATNHKIDKMTDSFVTLEIVMTFKTINGLKVMAVCPGLANGLFWRNSLLYIVLELAGGALPNILGPAMMLDTADIGMV